MKNISIYIILFVLSFSTIIDNVIANYQDVLCEQTQSESEDSTKFDDKFQLEKIQQIYNTNTISAIEITNQLYFTTHEKLPLSLFSNNVDLPPELS